MRILVVEDYPPVRNAVVQALEEANYAVDEADNGEDALWHARGTAYDLIILDIMLPKLNGLDVLKALRREDNQSTVLLLTARDSTDDRVNGLDTGADDYLVKPFALNELMARVRALVRRKYDRQSPLLQVGDLTINTAQRLVRRGENDIDLTPREYALLEFMAMRSGQVVSRSEIWEHVYDFHSDRSSNVVDVYVGYLRKKIETPETPKLLHTRRGHGYVLMEQS